MQEQHSPFPPIPLWVSVVWGISPAVILLSLIVLFTRQWPYLGWCAFLFGALNMYAFCAFHLCQKSVDDWELRAVPMTLLALVVNLGLVVLGGYVLAQFGLGIWPTPTGP